MDTRTGEIVMCHADGGRMVCTSSGEEVAQSSTTPEELEAARLRTQRAKDEARTERIERMMGLFESMLEMVREQQEKSATGQ